ncbi:MAG: hypothetical protein RLZZ618_1154 [Pseudomonadota bacterium]|jgi:hypothetical protein
MTTPDTLLAALHAQADANLIDVLRVHAGWQEPSQLEERDGLLMLAGATKLPIAYINCAVRVDRNLPPDEALQRATDFFRSHGRGFTMYTRRSVDADLEAFLAEDPAQTPPSSSPCMIVTAQVPMPTAREGISLERYTTAKHVNDALKVVIEAYGSLGLPEREAQVLFEHPQRLLDSALTGVVAYRAGEPVATALAIHTGRASGIYWVSTSLKAQRLGLASLCTAWVTNACFEQGATAVNLQASEQGAPVYPRLGYQTFDQLSWWHRQTR